jgi:NhaP-type Na+/H+ or K+/H+ antiporter
MLVLGLPLAIVLGTATAAFFLPSWPLVALALVAALLAPTDAALGQSVVANPLVPGRVRSALSVESGLNDGLALPAILLFASFSAEMMSSQDQNWLLFGLLQITLGPLVGVAMGYVGGKILILARDRDLTSDTFEGIAALAMAGAIYLAAVHVGGNGFIAAFVAGLTFGNIIQGRCKFIFEFTESEGQMFTWTAFFMLGLVMLPEAINKLTLPILGLILVSLFVVRPLAVWISLIGTGASPLTRIFFGWFGPRGLATALFALLILPDINHQIADSILAIAINAVWISALLHGVSAAPAAIYYARKVSDMGDCEENRPVAPVFSRTED